VVSGTPDDLTRTVDVDEISFTSVPGLAVGDLAAALALPETAVRESRPGEYVVAAPGTPARVAELAVWLRDADARLDELRTGRHSLEEVFLRLTSDGTT
jgi:ABC-2 type transport system ATP-binding protein